MDDNQPHATSPAVAWDDADTAFFRITLGLFSAQFTEGASTLLGTCDLD